MPKPPFSWLCPFCNQNATITNQNFSTGSHIPYIEGKNWHTGAVVEFIVCPNPDCRSYSFEASLYKQRTNGNGARVFGALETSWLLFPASNAKVFPEYVPKPVRDDYNEACAIKELSPKSSATLARRALQGMIRDFWSVKKSNLKQAIEALEEKVDPLVWKAIDGVRTIGNIGAHMEKDINLIVEVEPEEAEKLIWLIEFLVNDWYVARHNRQQGLKAIVELADTKKIERHGDGQL